MTAEQRVGLDEAVSAILQYSAYGTVIFLYGGSPFMGRVKRNGDVLRIELRPDLLKPQVPNEGITPFGWWLVRLWYRCCPRIKRWPGSIDLVWKVLRYKPASKSDVYFIHIKTLKIHR